MEEEVFYLRAGGELLVKPIRTDPIYDLAIVEYKGENYNLLWNPVYSYYQGTIDGQEGFMV
jgi:hypothetical protein